jgi:hypothetical protein
MSRQSKRQKDLNRSVDVLLLLRQRRIARAGVFIGIVLLGLLFGLCLFFQI